MSIEEKYKIIYDNNKRYYIFDMQTKIPILDNTVPYLFKYKDIEIYESSWNKMTLRILKEIDERNPKSNEELLSIKYYWSKQDVFSTIKKTNHTPFRDLFLNTNHSSTHAMMSIQCLLREYNIDLSECYFLIRRHPVSEPQEARQYFRSRTITDFCRVLKLKGFAPDRINTIIKNFDFINKFLNKVSTGFIDFFLFDDYYYFTNYKVKTMEEVEKRFVITDKTYIVIKRCLGYLDDYYKNKDFYLWLENNKVEQDFLVILEKELNFLFNNLKTTIVVSNKLYGRLSMLYRENLLLLGEMNNSSGLFKICSTLLNKKFFFNEPYISKYPIANLTNDQIICSYAYSLEDFTIGDLNNYVDKMHLKKLDNYLGFIIDSSEDYVQVDIDRLVSKAIFKLDDHTIEAVKKELNFYINSFGRLDSEKYSGFISLPKLRYEWNKYLLIGLIRSYLSNEFEIEYTANNYKKLSYIIDIKR